MAGEGPPFLTVGTDVSAKYRGAFCEAKVKVVKKLVKCKINFKNGTSCMVSDEFVKGTSLKIGTKVEAKMTESSPYEEGTIMKVIDGSLYTVVFDDGDEKTLRRTLLCLQGEKHFHESETLDHLPLTDPENFGTPVVKDSKIRRKRRMSNRSQRSEDEEEDDDDEEESDSDSPKKPHKEEPEDAVGKIVIVEMNEKRKNFFFPALVVDPSCTKDVQVKGKDYIVTRSFKDNKFYTVSKQSRKPFLTKDHTYKGDVASLKAAHEKAVTFIDTGQLPSNWDMDMLKKKSSGKQQADTRDDTSEDSSDDEYDMEKDAWLASLHKFMEERGTPINKPPLLGLQDLNLYKLYKLVQDHGGCRKVTDKQMWRHIMTKMNIIPVPAPQQPYNIHTSYNKYLFAFEEFNRKMGPGPRVFTRTRRRSFDRGWISPPSIFSRQRSSVSRQQGVKDEPSDKEEEEQESPTKKRVTRKKGEDNKSQEQEESKRETREAKSRSKDIDKQDKDTSDQDEKKSAKKPSNDDKVKEKASKDDKSKDKPSKDAKAKDNVKDTVKDKSGKTEKVKDKVTKDDKVKDKSKDTPSKDEDEKSSDGKEKLKDVKVKDKGKNEKVKEEKEDRAKEEKMKDVKSESKGPGHKGKDKRKSKGDSGREDNSSSPVPSGQITDAGYNVGEKVHVHYGRGRTEKIYEAKVVDIELKGKDHVFTVHYTGWNNRYDEAIKKNRIVGSAEKKKKPPKLTPKGKGDLKEKNKKDAEKRDREEQQRKDKEEAERREQEENERKAKQEREAREEAERLEKARAQKERQEKEKQERLERERKEKQERERLEKERKEKLERERREKLEREQQEKEQKEKLEKERQEREKKEKERKDKQEKDRREKLEQEKREKERAEAEKQERELAEKAAKEAEKERKDKAGKDAKKTPTGKRGRPSLNKVSSPAHQTPPRTTPSGRGKSPSPASVFSQRSMRSDRKSLTESPFAMGLNARARSKRSSTGEYRRGGQDDSDSELDELLDGLSESQQSNQESEDSQLKDLVQEEPDDHDDNESTKTEDYAATLTKVSEEKPSFDEFLDEGPPTLTAEVVPETLENRLQEVESEVPLVEVEDKVPVEKDGRGKTKKESKIRLRKSIDKEREGKDSGSESVKGEKVAGKDTPKRSDELDESKEKIDDTPVLERQVPMEAEVQERVEELKQEAKDSASDADKPTEKKKGRRKGRKSLESRKRSKASSDVAEVSEKSETSETSEPKKKHAKMEKKKEKGGRKHKVHESKTPADNTDSDFGTSSIDDKSIPGTSKSFMTTPPTTPEGSPKMPLSPAPEEVIQMKAEEQSSNKSDSDALIEVANIDEKELSQSRETNASLSGSTQPKSRTSATAPSQQASPKKRRRGTSESEHTKKRRKHSRRRQSISERRHSAKERGNNNSSDTDESRSESRLTSSSSKRHMSLKKYSGSLPPKLASSSERNGSQKQRRWNFLVDLSNVKEPDERIAIIQHQLSELRSVYLQLKQEVATIDRRRKKFRKKEREAAQVMAGVALAHCLSQGQERVDASGS